MYESEVNRRTESSDQLPSDAVTKFSEMKGKILARTVLPWGEHCTECVWPTCYSSCDLYTPRLDGGCRRFTDGMVRIDCAESLNGYLLKIRFKQWGKLWTPGNLELYSTAKAAHIEIRDHHIGTALHQLPLPAPVASILIKKRYGFKKRRALHRSHSLQSPTSFLLECYNPSALTIPLAVTFRSSRKGTEIPFQQVVSLSAGFNRVRIPHAEIFRVLNLNAPFGIELLPAHEAVETILYFGLMDFVQELEVATENAAPVKCVVWDLDNTLWDGTLAEHGVSDLQLKPHIADLLNTLDGRGILLSIASKNDYEPAMEALSHFHLDHLFLYPQIAWSPKGDAVLAIARELNIGLHSVMFIDDSEFELAQVRSSCPGVRCLNALEYSRLSYLDACRGADTSESSNRRSLYQVEHNRRQIAATFKEDYRAFLLHCNISLTIAPLTAENIDRVHELTQRTNQMNFSGTRYDRDLLRAMLATEFLDTYVMSCQDRFGSYGVVGFGVVDQSGPRLTDLMFSCRIQAKRVEHAFLGHILEHYVQILGQEFHANYRKTPRNEASGQVFADIGMQECGIHDGVTSLFFPRDRPIPNEGVIAIVRQQDPVPAGKPS